MERDNLRLKSYSDVAADYNTRWMPDITKEEEWFGGRRKDLADAIRCACSSRLPSGKGAGMMVHSHQARPFNRWPQASKEAEDALLVNKEKIENDVIDFESLYNLVATSIANVRGVGELTVYDIAHRIGCFIGLAPVEVYLHRGTRKGVAALGFSLNRRSIPMDEFPADLRRLNAAQLEDVLCLYQASLARIRGTE